jgi:hypothetical protein
MQGDESRHEAAYQKVMEELLQRDTDAAMCAFADMMHASIVMPAHLMHDGGAGMDAELAEDGRAYARARAMQPPQTHQSHFFSNFAALADSLGVYSARDYAACMRHLLRRWQIADLQVRRDSCWRLPSSMRVHALCWHCALPSKLHIRHAARCSILACARRAGCAAVPRLPQRGYR